MPVADERVRVFLFVATLGYSRRCHVAAFRHERQSSWFRGPEGAFLHFGGVTKEVLIDNPRPLVVGHDASTRGRVQRAVPGVRRLLGLLSAGLRAVSSPDEGEGRARSRIRQGKRHRWPSFRELGGDGVRGRRRGAFLMAGVDHDTLAGWLTRLQLTAIRDQLDEAAERKLTLRESLAMLVEREVSRKDERRTEMAFKIADFPMVRELTDFDFKAQQSVDKRQVRELATSRWVAHGDALLVLGPPGVGKTHLAVARRSGRATRPCSRRPRH